MLTQQVAEMRQGIRDRIQDNPDVKFSTVTDSLDPKEISWGYHDGLLKWNELQRIQSAIANQSTGRYNSYDFNEQYKYVYLSGTKAAFFTGNLKNASVEYIIEDASGIDRDRLDAIRGYLSYVEDTETQRIIADIFADAGLSIHSTRDSEFYGREVFGRTRSNSGEGNRRYQGWKAQIDGEASYSTVTDKDMATSDPEAFESVQSDIVSILNQYASDGELIDSFGSGKAEAAIQEDIPTLKELLKLQGTTTGGTVFQKKSLTNAANFILKESGRIMDADSREERLIVSGKGNYKGN